jgi:endonuclease/exonuclease/phosphatase (EEP) superfamily protein YafD
MLRLFYAIAAFGLLTLGLGYMGEWWPIGDAFAVVRLQVLVLSLPVILGLFLLGARKIAFQISGLVVLATIQTGLAIIGEPDNIAGPLTLYQKNLRFDGGERTELIAEILSSKAHIVTLQEVSDQNAKALAPLFAKYPYKQHCEFISVGGVMILSVFRFVPGSSSCQDHDGMALAQVVMPDQSTLWVGSVHLHWPWPLGTQSEQVAALQYRLKKLTGPILLAGDFNMLPWGASIERLRHSTGTVALGGYINSFPRFGVLAPLAIDHVLVPETASGTVEIQPLLGSDHYGLVAYINLLTNE